ncbi:extensin-like domain-containing protein [Variovorax sp. PAMC 28711]|uniref:extensin-like domain-containing protein n=1 Tax=Variovorax sp. PAMC 28711 TaxID=1795631 RepID=UPI00078B8EAF|nr:extensin family protein [Variovorax sp. PAMC 28711]AMM26441.1 extensin [Variovorax sp. PAMC 28711]
MKFTLARGIGWSLALAAAALAFGLYSGAIVVPARYDPWAPLDVTAPPDALTGFKLSRAQTDPARCKAALAQTGMQYDAVPDRTTGPGCGFDNAVRLRQAGVRFGAPLTLSCPMALSFAMWERHALQRAAAERFGQPVAAIEHLGSYACRNINRGEGATPGASRSRHATANALDVSGLTLRDGRRFSVQKNWAAANENSAAPDEGAALLRDAHRGACRYFDGVLGPDYNAVHRDHFHLETGGFSMCR